MKKKTRILLLASPLLTLSTPALAKSTTQDWFLPAMLAMVVISIIGGILITRQFKALESKGMQVLVFGLFFWVVMFAQGIIYALFLHQ